MIVEKFSNSDWDDTAIVPNLILSRWLESSKGRWVLENSLNPPVVHCVPNVDSYTNDVVIGADFTEENKTIFLMKWGIK